MAIPMYTCMCICIYVYVDRYGMSLERNRPAIPNVALVRALWPLLDDLRSILKCSLAGMEDPNFQRRS